MEMNLEKVVLLPPKLDEDADYLFSTIKQVGEIKAKMNEQITKLKEIEDEAEKLLLEYYKAQLEADPEYKGELNFGKFSKIRQKKWVYEDEKAIIKQLKLLNPKLIRVKEELDKTAFKKAFEVAGDGEVVTEDFQIIDGVHVEEEISYSVKVL